jgi:hypothetical protein
VILLIRDTDGSVETRLGFEQARREFEFRQQRHPAPIPVIVGIAHAKRECWVLAGFQPGGEDEQTALDSLRQELGFDPRHRAEELTAKRDHHAKSAKRVLRLLTNGDPDREAECWEVPALPLLEERGRQTGLAAYLDELRTRLRPLFI